MISLIKLLKNSFLYVILFAFAVIGCKKEPERKDYIARVNDSYLTSKDLADFDSLFNKGFSKHEIIKRWINKELLYQEAVKAGVTNRDDFKRIINNSREELAAAMLLTDYLAENIKSPSEKELVEYYEKHRKEFEADDNIYVYNYVEFKNENAAIKFRDKVVETNWEKAIGTVSEVKSLVNHFESKALSVREIYPRKLLNQIEELNSGEVSIIIPEKDSKYMLVQMKESYRRGTVPPFEITKSQVEERYSSEIREKIISEYIDKLYSNYEIEIKEK